jgi:hypothetical protein
MPKSALAKTKKLCYISYMTINKLITTVAITALIITSVAGITTKAQITDNNGCEDFVARDKTPIYTNRYTTNNPNYKDYKYGLYLKSGQFVEIYIQGCSNGLVNFSYKNSDYSRSPDEIHRLRYRDNSKVKSKTQNDPKCYDKNGAEIQKNDSVSYADMDYGKVWKHTVLSCNNGKVSFNRIYKPKYEYSQKSKSKEYIPKSGELQKVTVNSKQLIKK